MYLVFPLVLISWILFIAGQAKEGLAKGTERETDKDRRNRATADRDRRNRATADRKKKRQRYRETKRQRYRET